MSVQCSVFGIQWTMRRWFREVVCGVFADRDSMFVAAKGGGILDHFSEHSADFLGQHSEPLGLFACDVAVVERDKNPVLSFQILAVSVSQFARKVSWKPPLRPSFRYLGSDAPRSSAPLIGQGMGFAGRKSLCHREYFTGERPRALVNGEVGKGPGEVLRHGEDPVFTFRCSVLSERASAGKEHRTGNTAY